MKPLQPIEPEDSRRLALPAAAHSGDWPPANEDADATEALQLGRVFRHHWLAVLLTGILGAGVGVCTVILSSPLYKARLLLEVKGEEGLLKSALGVSISDTSDVSIQTMIE